MRRTVVIVPVPLPSIVSHIGLLDLLIQVGYIDGGPGAEGLVHPNLEISGDNANGL